MQNQIKKQLLSEFKGKKILVTGGTGSIGAGIVEQLLKYKPNSIRVLSNDPNSIFKMKKKFPNVSNLTFMVGDIRDFDRMKLVTRKIDIVFHAAAIKHTDICDQDPFDTAKTNVIGTGNTIESSILANVSKFIFISTDKAANPSSTLGSSKLFAENITRNASTYNGSVKTKFAVVRVGNFLGSTESIFQIFCEQLKKGNPLSISNPNMTRFAMSISEMASLILKATHVAKDGEIFVLKMPSVNVLNLAKIVMNIYKSRNSKSKTVPIKISKVRGKEQLHEFLISPTEIPFCYDTNTMYKISKEESKKKISTKDFSSETAEKITEVKLKKIINELLDEV